MMYKDLSITIILMKIFVFLRYCEEYNIYIYSSFNKKIDFINKNKMLILTSYKIFKKNILKLLVK